ncbi:uncharacterized protein LOC128246628 [Mya arenaria]|uniref:uncharacterized protein LOC128246628 n=1 Tax=Mya arenaria TaxID=6604 RepID=UPI0022E29C1F|nr:uncharacterized protein LOC128246628 [Mya arenaria]
MSDMVQEEYFQHMDKLEDLLPGIEQFLSNILARESLSPYAEEQRQYYLERLDIIKLPPSVPPRPRSLGVPVHPLVSTPESGRDSLTGASNDDFAAYQRELSRALIDSETSPDVTEVKVYDDIDPSDVATDLSEVKGSKSPDDDDDDVYEVPQLRRYNSDSGYEKAKDMSPLSKSTSSEEQAQVFGIPKPPPLPPRRDRASSDAASRSSIGSILDEHIITTPDAKCGDHSESLDRKSTHSAEEEYDAMSVGSPDDPSGSFIQPRTPDHIRLPRPTRRKARAQRKLGKSLTSLWEVSQPYQALDDVVISGELYYRSKLSWTKKLAALTNGRLVCYKVDKLDTRPSFVIILMGYLATAHKRDGRRSYEIHLDHDSFESHVFLCDFKEWADIWCEHLNAAAEGQRAQGPVVHLTREALSDKTDPLSYRLTKASPAHSSSNVSLAGSDSVESDCGKVKKHDHSTSKSAKVGQIAHRASLFFDSLSKRSSVKKSLNRLSSLDRAPSLPGLTGSELENARAENAGSNAYKQLIGTSSSQKSLPDMIIPRTPGPPELRIVEEVSPAEVKKHIKHQGFLDIYSSFNKRKWGKRWCIVHENNFECYRSPTSDTCELEFLLRNCALQRAIKETSSELGLMLTENNREKITIEPVSWSELGSWLRVLMAETSTPSTPDGLQGYMDDTHPYHEAVEITRKPQASTAKSQNSKARTKNVDRDSGICSSESADGRFGSLERASKGSPTASTVITVHKDFSDSSLPRVSVQETGAIYTMVRKSSGAGSQSGPSLTSSITGVTVQAGNKKGESSTAENLIGGKDTQKISAMNASHTSELDESGLFEDFEANIAPLEYKRGESLVDEIMSQFQTQLSSSFSTNSESSEQICGTTEHDNKNHESSDTHGLVIEDPNDAGQDKKSTKALSDLSRSSDPSKRSSFGRNMFWSHEDQQEILAELRTRLVQLKQDRITIRNRKEKVTCSIDREFLSAEFDRLDRECKKVADEIKSIEEEAAKYSAKQVSERRFSDMDAIVDYVIEEEEISAIEEEVSVIDEEEVEFIELTEIKLTCVPEDIVGELEHDNNKETVVDYNEETNGDLKGDCKEETEGKLKGYCKKELEKDANERAENIEHQEFTVCNDEVTLEKSFANEIVTSDGKKSEYLGQTNVESVNFIDTSLIHSRDDKDVSKIQNSNIERSCNLNSEEKCHDIEEEKCINNGESNSGLNDGNGDAKVMETDDTEAVEKINTEIETHKAGCEDPGTDQLEHGLSEDKREININNNKVASELKQCCSVSK